MKAAIKYIPVFLLTVTAMTLALVGIAMIPRDRIQKKSEESAACLMRRNVSYYNLVGGASGRKTLRPGDYSKVDQIADAYLLDIAYCLDAEHPLESALWARYYDGRQDTEEPLGNMNESYLCVVTEQPPANMQYLRYWHGSLVFVRPMLMFWNLDQIRIFYAVELLAMLTGLIILLLRNGLKAEAVCFGVSMFAVSVWFVPVSLEYTWMFLVMPVSAFLAVKMALAEKENSLYMLFFVTGMITAFLDFFTTETVTLLIPLLLSLRILHRKGSNSGTLRGKAGWLYAGKCILLWGTGYVATWTAKWGLSAIVFRENTIPFVRERFWLHLGVEDGMSAGEEMLGAIVRNLHPLFPFGYGRLGAVLFFALVVLFVFVPVCRNRLAMKRNWNRQLVLLYVLLGLTVYFRYLVLNQHSYRHYFFTYRAQAASVLALCFIVLELVEYVPKGRVLHAE